MSNDDILGKGITGNQDPKRDIIGGGAADAISGALNTSADRGWLPAPYNIIVAPVNAGGGQTAQGNDYERSLEQYMTRAARVDQNEEAKQIRQAWSTPPRVSIENGMLQLSGTKAFLQSDTAKQLRAVFKEMKGQTYNTEALNRQIEAWNTDLQKMSESYMTNLDNYNKINFTTLQNARGPQPGMISFNEYMMLMNSARVGQDPDAASSNKLIFVGYEWDDKGNRTPVYKTAAEFFEEFNSTPDSKKRDAYRDLITQANQGDPAAMSKLFYLRGGSEGGPANVTYSAGERWNDFLRTAWENTVIGLAEAADFVTTYVPIINLPRLAGRVGQAINAQDASKFFASDFIREGIDNFEDVVGWENAYFSQLTPGSTQLAALSGGAIGTVLGMAYSIWAGSVGNAALMSAVNKAFTAAGNYALGTGKFVEYTGTYSSTTGKLQKVVVMDGARVAGEIPRVVDPVVGGARGSVVIPKFIFDKWPGLAEGMAKVGLELQLATGIGGAGSVANLAGRAGDTAGELRWAFSGPTQNLAARWTEGGRILLDAESLAKLRSQANALRMAANLYALGNESAIRHVDQYFQKENRGEDPGNMAEYVAGGVARDIILGGSMIAGGAIVSHIANLSRSSNIPARVVWEGGYTSSLNSQSGFYSMPKMLGTGGATIDTDIANTVNSVATVNGEKIFFSPVEGMMPTVIPGTEGGGAFGAVSTLENAIGRTTIEPVVGGFAVVTETTNLDTNNKITTTKFFSDLDEANNYVAKTSIPTVNPSTLMNSDLAATGNIVPFNVGGRSALKLLPNGVSHARIQPDITYLTPAEYADEVTPIVEMMSPELRAAYEKTMITEDVDSLSQQIYAKDAPLLDAPRLFVPRTEAEAIELAQSVARARAVAAANPTSSPIMPVRTEPDEIEIVKRRKTVEVEQRTPRNIAVTEYGLPKRWFSNVEDALAYKNEKATRSIYKIDNNATVLDRPPVTMDNIYLPGVRGEMGVTAAMDPVDFKYTPNTSDAVERFNGLMAGMPTLIDSPTDYTQGIVDIAAQVKAVHDEIAKAIDLDAIYEDYARQIAEGVEQPTVPDDAKETLKPLTDMLTALGKYFDPSGKSLTQEFYLPTGAPSKKLATIEDALLHPEKAVDPDQVLDGSFDDILIDPLRVGDEGFWEKRTGELFRNEDGEFTMAKAGTLEENLMAYTVSALTRGPYRLLVTANDEVALSKADRNRNTITTKQALKGLKSADKNRARIRAAQLKAARSYDRAMKKEKMGKLVEDYSDEATINAIEEAYAARNFVKELDYTRRANKDAKTLGYRQTLTINPIKGSALRFGTETGIKGIANDIRAASHITVTGTKWVRRDDEYVNVGFGMSEGQKDEYEFTRIEPAVNLGDSATLMFSPDRAARKLFENIQSELAEYTTTGGWGLTNILNKYACKNFPLVTNPKKSINKLTKQIASDFEAYNGTEAFNVAVLSRLSTWIKNSAANNINSAIQMADITNLDDRTIRAIDQIMTKANVGVAVYQGKIVSALQQLAYQATLAFNFSPMVGNILSEPERAVDFFGPKVFVRAMKKMANPKEVARVKKIVGDLPSRFADDREMVGLAEKAKTLVGRAAETYTNIAMNPLQKSEEFKNILFWLCAEENAKLLYPNDKLAQMQNTLRTFNDTAIAGGPGTTPGVANSDLGRAAFILKTFSLRNWDDFIEMVQQIGMGRSGSYKWDRASRGRSTGGQGGYSSTAGGKMDWKKVGRFMGGTLLRRYLLWLLVLGPLGRSIWDALGGDPTGLTENYSRGLYDDEGTDAYEGMTPIDNIINQIPTGFIFGTLKDFYFAARRAGVETGNFFGGVDITKDPRLQKDLRQHLPLGVVTNRIGDMLELLDRGYSYNSYGNKTYAAPESIGDVIKGFMLGKSTTSNAQAYNKYRYGSVNIWGDLFEGDWMDFAMSANPFADDLGLVKFDSTRKDYNGVFHGSYNDVPTMQAAIADLRKRRADIIDEYNKDLEKFTGEFQGLNDAQKKALAEKRREAKIQTFTEDVQRLVDEYQKAGNALSDKQINTMMYLFDFNEGDDDTYDSQAARERYVEAGLPDFDPINQTATRNDEGETTEQNYFQRSLVYQNAVQGRYGIPRDAAKAVDLALADFKSTYKAYKKRVSDLNDKAYSAAKGSAERKKYQAEVEKIQEQYLDQLYSALTPVVQKYGTEVLSSNDVIEFLQPYMSSMIPYSSIRKYGLTFSSGNDIVWGQLSDWVKNRWGASAPITGSDPEITQGLKTIKSLRDQGKVSQAKSQARLLLERIARGSLSARNNDVIELRRILND